MSRVVIVGGGFAGLCAARRLSRATGVEVTLLDKRCYNHYLPMLPDLIGASIRPSHLMYPFSRVSERLGCAFRSDEVREIDLVGKAVRGDSARYPYDRLLIASGAETDFHGMDGLREHSLVVEDACGTARIRDEALNPRCKRFLIVGGSYTGVEVATQLWRLFRKRGLKKRIVIADIGPSLCRILPPSLQEYVARTLDAMDIAVHLGTSLEEYDGRMALLSSGESFADALLVWAAGRRTARFVQAMGLPQAAGGRLIVDSCLRIGDDAFGAGDATAFMADGKPHRPAVQSSVCQGAAAADNILRSLDGRELREFLPVDMGYVVPLGNRRGCGVLLGFQTRGRLPSWLHYLFWFYRAWGIENRVGVMADLLWRDRGCPPLGV